jgi:thiamine biosynthesis lipoprotein
MSKYKYLPPVIVICAILGVVAARALRPQTFLHRDSDIMMDTFVEISIWAESQEDAESAARAAFLEIARVESLFGDGVVCTDSDSAAINSQIFNDLLEISGRAANATSGMFDPTIGSVSQLWEFHDGAVPPSGEALDAALACVGFSEYLKGNACGVTVFDLGGVAKGYAVDLAAARLGSLGIESAIINAGGDLRLLGRKSDGKPWRIAIRHPRRPGEFLGYLEVEDAAVATSGDYEKCFFEAGSRYHHILDPTTGMPGRTCNSVTVVASSACLGDALATGLFILGPRRGLAVAEAVFAFAEGESLAVSPGLADRFVRPEGD